MNKNVIIGVVLIVLAGLGYYQFSVVPAQKAAEEAATAAAAAEEAAATAAAEAEAAAAKAAEEAAAAAAKVEADAAAAAEAAATDAANTATEAATDAATTATDAATDATAAAGDAMSEMGALLDPANFDADKVIKMIDESTLADDMKTALKAAVEGARTTPTLVEPALAQVKAALGM